MAGAVNRTDTVLAVLVALYVVPPMAMVRFLPHSENRMFAVERHSTSIVPTSTPNGVPLRLIGRDPPNVLRSSTTVPKTVPPQLAVTPAVMIAMTDPRQAQPEIEEVRTSDRTA